VAGSTVIPYGTPLSSSHSDEVVANCYTSFTLTSMYFVWITRPVLHVMKYSLYDSIFVHDLTFINAVRVVCGAGSMHRSNVRPSVCLSVPSVDCSSHLLIHVCCRRRQQRAPQCCDPKREYRRSLTVLGLSALSLPVATLAHVAPHQTILTDVAMHQGLYTQYSCEKNECEHCCQWFSVNC